jgi:glycosyltransferase involved in cell wall biosynthesis
MVEELPLVSIVVPVYNGSAYLREAIDSILDQDYANVEVIAVDDGSTDDTAEILASYGRRIQVIRQENAGQSAALNRGWSASSGSIIGYLSADDVLRPSAVSRSVELLTSRAEIDATYCDYELISPESHVTRRVHVPSFDFPAVLRRFELPMGPGCLFRRSIYETVGGWNPDYVQNPDYDFWLRSVSHGRVARIDEVLAGFRVHDQSATFRKVDRRRADEPIRVIEGYFQDPSSGPFASLRGEAMGMARVVAARAHLRAGRYVTAFRRLAEAATLSRRSILNSRALKLVGSGLFGRLRHKVLWRLARRRRSA